MTCGIYCIENILNNKKYIGRSENIESRFRSHINALNRKDKVRENINLIYSWNLYGENNFLFYIIEECDIDSLNDREIYYIKKFNTNSKDGYNFTTGGEGVVGYKHREDSLQKMSGKNNHMYGKTGENHHMFGKHHSDETKAKLRECFLKEKSPVFGTKKPNSASRFYGVSIHNHKTIKKGKEYAYFYYVAKTKIDKKTYIVGYFKDEVLAAEAYDFFVINNNLKNPLNFPDKKYDDSTASDRSYPELENLKI